MTSMSLACIHKRVSHKENASMNFEFSLDASYQSVHQRCALFEKIGEKVHFGLLGMLSSDKQCREFSQLGESAKEGKDSYLLPREGSAFPLPSFSIGVKVLELGLVNFELVN